MSRLDTLQAAVETVLGARVKHFKRERRRDSRSPSPQPTTSTLRRRCATIAELHFEQLIDLCGIDYSAWQDRPHEGPALRRRRRTCCRSRHNWRLRLKVFCPDDDMPIVASVTPVWNSANWFEREAFDLYGIIFEGHLDLRRILTDYGFIGHPFRKDFPTSGHVEMRYDAESKRVIYQPVTHRAARDHAAHHPRRQLRRSALTTSPQARASVACAAERCGRLPWGGRGT